ncbi:MAG: methyltransferase domain-containing protein [Acidobacteriota bacterium]|nr:methyltransferase domain-containing protein [Acidobacteriota bacterium]
MDIRGWNQSYRSPQRQAASVIETPNPLLVEVAQSLKPGKALDLACGAGRNALWLARHRWRVTAVDGATAAIDLLRERARDTGESINAQVADLQSPEFEVVPDTYDLIAICFYLQRNLFAPAQRGLKRAGILLAIVHTTEANQEPTETRLRPGDLRTYFEGWEIVHYYEGGSRDPAHKRPVAEIVARRAQER